MKNLLIGLLMLVTTNSFETTVTTVCVKGMYYHVERSAVHTLVEKVFKYNKMLNAWFPHTCKKA